MQLRRILLFAFGTAAALMSGAPALAQPMAPPEARDDASAWLTRIHDAASLRNYQGTQVYSRGGVAASSRVAHYSEGNQQYERVEALDGEPRRIYRHNEVVVTLWPQKQLAVIEQREPLPPFPALLQAGGDRVTDHYDVRQQGTDRLAGYDADVFLLKPRDRQRFAQRLWAEKNTGLLLRADVLGLKDEVLESVAFSELAIGVKPQPESVLQPVRRLDGYHVVRTASRPTQLDQEGWGLKPPVAGFRQVSCVRRAVPVMEDGDRPGETLQTIFSDGLTHVSLFIEPFDPQRHLREGYTAFGATHTLMLRRYGDWWLTVVGDVPLPTLKQFAAALERRR